MPYATSRIKCRHINRIRSNAALRTDPAFDSAMSENRSSLSAFHFVVPSSCSAYLSATSA